MNHLKSRITCRLLQSKDLAYFFYFLKSAEKLLKFKNEKTIFQREMIKH